MALHDFANRNWLHEEQLGRMMALRIGEQYEKDRSKFVDQIERHQKKVEKAVDLFSRIKNTEQAEEVMTVLYASRQLKQAKPGEEVSEQQLYDYILGWKKTWNSDDKKHAVASTIRNLVLLDWMRVQISESMIEAA